MNTQMLRLTHEKAHSFCVRRDTAPEVNNHWHCYKELELIQFEKGSGIQFIGDSIHTFEDGDIVLVGPQLPHYWCFDDIYFSAHCKTDVRVVRFSELFWGKHFLDLPENKKIKTLFDKCRQAILFKGPTTKAVGQLMEQLVTATCSSKIVLLLKILSVLADNNEGQLLSSPWFRVYNDCKDLESISAIYQYALLNFKRKIYLEEVAKLANVSSQSFCRYFKNRTNKTFTRFITEIRVAYACKLLLQNRLPAKLVCYESGFNNIDSFHKFFKGIKGMTPKEYQKRMHS